jgi:hypothetical protein
MGVFLGQVGPEHRLVHSGCPQGHDSVTTLELPMLYSIFLDSILFE